VQKTEEIDNLRDQGASVVLTPFDDAADYAVRQLVTQDEKQPQQA